MGAITAGTGLISGLDTAGLIDALITLESATKFRLQERVGILQTQKTALLDVNSRLLNFKNTANSFRTSSIFQSTLVTSSNDEVLTATTSVGAQPGSFTFIVKQLVSTSQKISQGYATHDESPMGLDSMSFEFGNGNLSRDMLLEDLNGGQGVDRGNITITDREENVATIDLTDVATLSEVLDRINDEDDINVIATVSGDHILLTDTSSAPTGSLQVEDASGDTTAADLGILGTAAGATLTGTDIVSIGADTSLSTLNDGNGVLIRNNVNDLQITARDGTVFTVDLGRVDADITTDTLLEDLNNGDGVTITDDEENPDIKFIDRDGTEYEVDLSDVTTVGGLITRVNSETSGRIQISITDGEKFTVTDTVGGALNLRVLGAGDNGDDTAEDLGILNETGVAADTFDGDLIPNTISDPAATTIQDVLDRINNAVGNDGRVVASINAAGLGLQLTDTTGMTASNLIVESLATNPDAASDLGIEVSTASATYTGDRLTAGLNSVLIDSINGGAGLGGATTITISDRLNRSFTINDLDTYDSLTEVVDAINAEAATIITPAEITVSLNATGNGLTVTDTSGGTNNLTISGDAATALGLTADVASDSVAGDNLQLQYVDNSTKLEDLNYGRGVGTGSFKITDGLGDTATVSIGGTEDTLYDVIQEINSRGLAVTARVNDNGDGLIIEEDAAALGGQTPIVEIKIEAAGGTTAADLNILGESDDIIGGYIDGSYERVVELEAGDTLENVIEKINDANIPVSASLLNTGSGGSPYRMNLSTSITGRAGSMVIDTGGVDLGLTSISEGKDAKVFFGAEDPKDGFLITSDTNILDQVIQGVDIDLLATSDEAVTLTITRDTATIVDTVKQLTTTFNDVIGNIDSYDSYDVDTEEKGILLGDPTVARVRSSLYRVATGSALNVDGSLQYLSQVGISFNRSGQLTMDESEFLEAYASDPQGVEELFAAYDVTTGASEEVASGVTVTSSDPTYNSLGFGNLFDRLLEELTDSIDGTMTLADETVQNQIDLLNDRIEDWNVRLASRRDRLTQEYANLESTLAQLQAQTNSISAIQLITISGS